MTLTGFGRVGDNNFGVADFIVDAGGLSRGATHTTITSALASASSGDTIFIRPGTYTENFSLKAGVNLCAFNGDSSNGIVTVVGKITASYSGTASITGLRLQTNSDFALVVSGASSTNLFVTNCYLNFTNNTGISGTAASGAVVFDTCLGDLGTTGIGVFASSGTSLNFRNTYFTNSGGSSTANTISAGTLIYLYSSIFNPTTTSGTSNFNGRWSTLSTVAQNATALTVGGSGTQDAQHCSFVSGTASAISISSTFDMEECMVSSTNANIVTGAGTVRYSMVECGNSGSTINTTTTTPWNMISGPISFDDGTNFLDFYEEGTFTPVIIGSSAAGAGTYSVQVGRYQRIGNRVFFSAYAVWSAHTGTGNIYFGGLPYTSANVTNNNAAVSVWAANLTFAANAFLEAFIPANNTLAQIQYTTSGATATAVPMDTAASLMMAGSYEV